MWTPAPVADARGATGDARKPPVIPRQFIEKRTVLAVDSSEGGFFTLRKAFAATKEPHMVRRVRDGAEALAYVIGHDEFSDLHRFPFPDLIVAESALPKVSGVEMLGYLRRELGLKVPVVVVAGSLVLD